VASRLDVNPLEAGVTPDEALERLLEGNRRFVAGAPEAPGRDADRRRQQAEGQTPFAVVVGCSDSRVPPEILFDQGIGDLFVVRVAGNVVVDEVTLGSIEFGVAILACPLVLVLGHEECGAVRAAVVAAADGEPSGAHLGALVDAVLPAVTGDDVDAAVRANVRRQVALLKETFPQAEVVGARYALESGRVELVG
jgi:carbonic anhydrase